MQEMSRSGDLFFYSMEHKALAAIQVPPTLFKDVEDAVE